MCCQGEVCLVLYRLHLVRSTNGLSYLYALLAHSRKSDLALTWSSIMMLSKSLARRGFLYICIAACDLAVPLDLGSAALAILLHYWPLLWCCWTAPPFWWCAHSTWPCLLWCSFFLWSLISGLLPLWPSGKPDSYGQLLEKGFYRGSVGALVTAFFLCFTAIPFPEFRGTSWWVPGWWSEAVLGDYEMVKCSLSRYWHPSGSGYECWIYSSLI